MKIVLGNLVSILIREEDFTEVNVEQEEVSYLRPNGTRAKIKFSQTLLAPKANNEDKDVSSAKKDQRIAAAELERQKRKETWTREQAIKEEKFHKALADNYKELKECIKNVSQNFKDEIEKLQIRQVNEISTAQKEDQLLKIELDRVKNHIKEAKGTAKENIKALAQDLKRMSAKIDNLNKDSTELKEKYLQQESNMDSLRKTLEEKIQTEANELEQLMNEITEENCSKIYKEIDSLVMSMDHNFKRMYDEEIVPLKHRLNTERIESEANNQPGIKETKTTDPQTPNENRTYRRLIKPF